MSAWSLALLGMLPALAVPCLAACRGPIASRFAAVVLANAILLPMLMAASFAMDQPSDSEFALAEALLGLPAILLLALCIERWL